MYFLLLIISLLNFSYKGNLEIKDAWLRPAGKGMNTALYFKIVNTSDRADTLLSVSSSAAELVQMHETFKQGDMMGMRQVKAIAVDAKSVFEFKPGGFHIMVLNLKKDLKIGASAEFILHFKYAGSIRIKAKVKIPEDN